MSIDYRTLLAEQIEADWEIETETVCPHDDAPYTVVAVFASPDELADAILATRIPGLPIEATFADLLRWGENVAKAMQTDRGPVITSSGYQYTARELLAALRTEADR